MKKMIVVAVILALLIGGGIANVSASWWGSIDAEMINGTAVIGRQQMTDEEIMEKVMNLFAEPMPTPTPKPTPTPVIEPIKWDWLGCP